ncbi:MAG: DUF1931 family protein [Micromonosporaceae bacterium]
MFGVTRFERFFRTAAGLDVDKDDLKRYSDFVYQKLHDLILMGEVTAEANNRDLIQPYDFPITKGLQQNIHRFRKMDEEIGLRPILQQLAAYPPLNRTMTEETEARLPLIIGGLSVALAQTFKTIDPKVKNPQTEDWERAFRLFDLLL